MPERVAAIDQGTSSTRCLIFDREGRVVASDQKEHRQHFPRAGWVEHDPEEIWQRTQEVVAGALARGAVERRDLAAVGITNQRETVVVWERASGRPLHPAIVWQDTRTAAICAELGREGGPDRFRARTGLPLSTYFSAPKLRWLLENVDGLRARATRGEVLAGTIDSWLVWNLSGGPAGGLHLTDPSNASRTMLLDLETLDWDPELLAIFGVPRAMLPEVRSSSELLARVASGPLAGVPIAAILGDQQAALVGQTAFAPGEAKNTYGTGCFLLMNTGGVAVPSRSGLLTTVAYRFGRAPACYALEGSVAVAGALVQWLRDNLGVIPSADTIEALARSVDDSGGAYIVPAFSGLFAPYWRPDARGVIAGLTRYVNRAHLARAALEATAYQTRELIAAMERDSGVALRALKVDGGMVVNDLLMQFQADQLGVPVQRPRVAETTALGAAYAAGLAVGLWPDLEGLRANWGLEREWRPGMAEAERERLFAGWKKAVERSLSWVE